MTDQEQADLVLAMLIGPHEHCRVCGSIVIGDVTHFVNAANLHYYETKYRCVECKSAWMISECGLRWEEVTTSSGAYYRKNS